MSVCQCRTVVPTVAEQLRQLLYSQAICRSPYRSIRIHEGRLQASWCPTIPDCPTDLDPRSLSAYKQSPLISLPQQGLRFGSSPAYRRLPGSADAFGLHEHCPATDSHGRCLFHQAIRGNDCGCSGRHWRANIEHRRTRTGPCPSRPPPPNRGRSGYTTHACRRHSFPARRRHRDNPPRTRRLGPSEVEPAFACHSYLDHSEDLRRNQRGRVTSSSHEFLELRSSAIRKAVSRGLLMNPPWADST